MLGCLLSPRLARLAGCATLRRRTFLSRLCRFSFFSFFSFFSLCRFSFLSLQGPNSALVGGLLSGAACMPVAGGRAGAPCSGQPVCPPDSQQEQQPGSQPSWCSLRRRVSSSSAAAALVRLALDIITLSRLSGPCCCCLLEPRAGRGALLLRSCCRGLLLWRRLLAARPAENLAEASDDCGAMRGKHKRHQRGRDMGTWWRERMWVHAGRACGERTQLLHAQLLEICRLCVQRLPFQVQGNPWPAGIPGCGAQFSCFGAPWLGGWALSATAEAFSPCSPPHLASRQLSCPLHARQKHTTRAPNAGQAASAGREQSSRTSR